MIKLVFSSVFLLSSLFLMSSEQTYSSLSNKSMPIPIDTRSVPIPKCPPYNSQSNSTLYVPIPECPINKAELFPCLALKCKKNYKSKNSLERHKSSHFIANFPCTWGNKCTKKCISKDSLEKHMQFHKNKTYFKCTVCKHPFSTLKGLGQHRSLFLCFKPNNNF